MLPIYDAFVRADAIEVAAREGGGEIFKRGHYDRGSVSRRTNPVIETHLGFK